MALDKGHRARINDKMEALIERNANGKSGAFFGSVWDWECYDKNGNLKWTDRTHNTVMQPGLMNLLNCMFHGQIPPTTWYTTLFESDTAMTAGTATYAAPGYTESTSYDELVRQEFTEATATTAGTCSITNSANKATFTISGTKTIYGAALVGGTCGTWAAVKNDTTAGGAILFCASKFSIAKSVVDDDVIKLTVTVNAISA
jgi:hypothetical protein